VVSLRRRAGTIAGMAGAGTVIIGSFAVALALLVVTRTAMATLSLGLNLVNKNNADRGKA
jgi:hypothetical protein